MNNTRDIEQENPKESSLEFALKRRQRKDAAVLIIVIVLAAVLGYLIISNMAGFYNML